MVVVRIVTGVRRHWAVRASEWVMVYPAIGMGLALTLQDSMFSMGGPFVYLARWWGQSTWAIFVLLAALIRLAALTINGTFKSFPYSPHMRLVACMAGVLFWSQYCMGFVNAAYSGDGAWPSPVAYSTFVLLEFLNVYRVWGDVARGRDE